ncbi:MAG: hypothetical protein IPK10_00740 [Bacteroidetes bacterium]|nr:hypothetical protein [Bacteroidota bacterium]
MSLIFVFMLSRFLALTLMVVFLMGSFTKSLLFLDYEFRQDYFASVLCEKKDIPDNICHGMCHLKKEIKKQDERENKQGKSELKSEINAISISFCNLLFYNHGEKFQFTNYLETFTVFSLLKDLRPPIV